MYYVSFSNAWRSSDDQSSRLIKLDDWLFEGLVETKVVDKLVEVLEETGLSF